MKIDEYFFLITPLWGMLDGHAAMKSRRQGLILELIERISKQISAYDKAVEDLTRTKYPQTAILRSVHGVGPIASLTFVLTIADKDRFPRSRDVGSYLGLRPKRSQSGDRDPQLRITKAGDAYMRKILISVCSIYSRPVAPTYAIGPHRAVRCGSWKSA